MAISGYDSRPPAGQPPGQRRAPSPCIGICRMDADNRYCSGCLRTLDEVATWSTATEERRYEILKNVAERRAGVEPAP